MNVPAKPEEIREKVREKYAALAEGLGCRGGAGAPASEGRVANAFVRARRPAAATGSAPRP